MREIMFKGKDKDDGHWVYGVPVQLNRDKDRWFIIRCFVYSSDFAMEYVTPVEVIPETVGQYTGRNDSFDERIYKSDILQIIRFDACLGREEKPEEAIICGNFEIVFDQGSFGFFTKKFGFESLRNFDKFFSSNRFSLKGEKLAQYEIKVIGNVTDTPENLEEEL